MPEIVITEFMSEPAVDRLRARFDVHYDADLHGRPAAIAALLGEARALIVRNRTRVDATLLQAGPRLAAVGRLGVGLDNIDLAACAARGIGVHPATGANVAAVAEYVIAAVLLAVRGVFRATEEMLAGHWPRERLMGGEVAGKTLGIVGFGAIGREVAVRARGLGMRVVAHDAAIEPDDPCWSAFEVERTPDLESLLAASEAVTLHVPLLDSTRHLIDAAALGAMKAGACLVNTARGGVVDEHALCDALRSGHLGTAVLDVFEQEPLPAGSHLDGVPNLLLTPHVAGVTREANVRVSDLIAARIEEALT